MKSTYPQTYDYLLEAIESSRVYNLFTFNTVEREKILRLFLREVPINRLEELNEDFFPEIPIEVAIIYPNNKYLREKAIDILWNKYDVEIEKIFSEAESDDFKKRGGISDNEDWRSSHVNEHNKNMGI